MRWKTATMGLFLLQAIHITKEQQRRYSFKFPSGKSGYDKDLQSQTGIPVWSRIFLQ